MSKRHLFFNLRGERNLKDKKNMERKIKIIPPMMPNFVSIETPARPRQEGFKPNSNSFPIEDFTREEAEEFGELMKQEFIKHWEKKILSK